MINDWRALRELRDDALRNAHLCPMHSDTAMKRQILLELASAVDHYLSFAPEQVWYKDWNVYRGDTDSDLVGTIRAKDENEALEIAIDKFGSPEQKELKSRIKEAKDKYDLDKINIHINPHDEIFVRPLVNPTGPMIALASRQG